MTESSENQMPQQPEDEIDLLDLLIVVAKNKKMILRNTFAAALVAVVVSFLMPKIYTASTTIMPPQQGQSTAAAMLGQLGGLAGMAGTSLGIKNPADLYIGMLKSRTVADDLVKSYDLKTLYKKDTGEEARKSLEDYTVISAGKDGLIKIEFTDKDPKRASDIANAYVDELNKVTSTLAVTEASQRRLFFESQLNLVKDKLAKAESDLQELQKKSGMIQVYPQEKEIAESNARLRAEIAAREVQLSAMQVGVTTRNPEYQRIHGELASLKSRLDGMGAEVSPDTKMTQSGLEYIEKFRDVKFNQALMELLYKQFELAKIDEAKDYPLIQVLDKAMPPEKKSKPKRTLIVIVSTVAAFFLSIFWAFIREVMERGRGDPVRSEKYDILKKYLVFKKK